MSIFFWKKRRKPKSAWRRLRKPRSFFSRRPQLESLEERIVLSPTLLNNYTGISSAQSSSLNGGALIEPPDTQGAAGPSSTVETVNLAISIFSPKSTGAAPVTDSTADFFFTQGGLNHASTKDGQSDTFTLFDPLVQRFIVGEIDFDTANTNGDTNYLLLAVSKSANPATLTTADWNFDEVNTTESSVSLQDYPGNPGYNADALVVTLNGFDSSNAGVHSQVNAISMNALVNGTPLSLGTNLFQTDNNEFLMRPTTMQDSASGGPMWFVAEKGDNKSIDVIRMDNVLSSSPTFTTTNLAVTPYSTSVNELNPDGTKADTLADSRILKSSEINGLLVTTHEVSNAAGNLDDARWYAIDVSSGTPVLQQQGDVSGGPGVYISYPSIDINAQGDIGMTFIQSGTSPGMFESLYATGRTPSDAPGTMETPILIQAGNANYVGTREGDMTGINVDSDGSFWAFGQYANNDPSPNWGTAIGHFTFAAPISILLNSAVEGQPLTNVPVAVFTDSSGAPLSSYTATIFWGDGSSSAGQVVATSTPNTFLILGSHTYAEEGDYTLSVSENNGTVTLGPVSGIVKVADAPLTGSAQALNAEAGGFADNALVAVFTDTDPSAESSSNYTATIQWFEGNGLSFSGSGRIVFLSGGNVFAVYGSSPYSFPSGGLYTVRVVIRDVGGATVTVDSVISIAHNPAIPPLIPEYQSDTTPVNAPFVAMEDALTNLLNAERLFLLALNIGTMPEKTGSFGNLFNAYLAYQAAILQYDMQLPGS